MMDEHLTGAGGYCTPLETLYQSPLPGGNELITFPKMSAQRGGFDFTDRRTDAERAASAAVEARTRRTIDTLMARRRSVIDAACMEALENGWDVNLYFREEPYRRWTPEHIHATAYVGIWFTDARYTVPTIIEHRDHDAGWDD